MSLRGHSVVVTRARCDARADPLTEALQARGAEVINIPAIAIVDPDDWTPVDEALARIDAFDMALLTSQNAAKRFAQRLADTGGASLADLRIGCVGARTADWVREQGAADVLVPETFVGEALADAVIERLGDVTGRRFLLPQAAEARGKLGERLTAAGAVVEAVTVYRIGWAPPADVALLRDADAFTFMSGRTLEGFLRVLPADDARAALDAGVVAVIGPVAQEAADRLGVRVDVMPDRATAQDLVDALDAALPTIDP